MHDVEFLELHLKVCSPSLYRNLFMILITLVVSGQNITEGNTGHACQIPEVQKREVSWLELVQYGTIPYDCQAFKKT